MSLIVGVNSYMTVEEANDLIKDMYISSSKERELWNHLSEEDKETIIISGTQLFDRDSMCYFGYKVGKDQVMKWPRIILGKEVSVPVDIKYAILAQTIGDIVSHMDGEGSLMDNGIKSFADGGGAKIEFFSSSENNGDFSKNNLGISKGVWRKYVKKWSYII